MGTMKITRKKVAYVARLARLDLSSELEKQFTRQLNMVLEYMERLKQVDTKGVEPASRAIPTQNAFREDEIRPSLPKETALDNAPARKDDFFVVPRVI
jgi:aspartyl-tRNA(Asn)/glutamyl-tRNA(Gln) amidotransferase subunit C